MLISNASDKQNFVETNPRDMEYHRPYSEYV